MSQLPRRLAQGYSNFKANRLGVDMQRYRVLSKAGQRPDTMVIGCCDSRAAPETIFDASPGELFVVRNVSNLVPPFEPDATESFHGTSAALEFGMLSLRMRHIVVLGHGRCGGIAGFLNNRGSGTDFLGKWLSLVAPAYEELRTERTLTGGSGATTARPDALRALVVEVGVGSDRPGLLSDLTGVIARAGGNIVSAHIGPSLNRFTIDVGEEGGMAAVEALRTALASVPGAGTVSVLLPDLADNAGRQQALELKAIEVSLRNLRSFPFIRDLEAIGDVSLHGAWFDIGSGQLLGYDRESKRWLEQ